MLGLFSSGGAGAVGEKTPDKPAKLTNADLMKLPGAERRYWVHGAISSLAATLMNRGEDTGECVWDWFGENSEEAYSLVQQAFERYPDAGPNATVLAVANIRCPGALK